MLVNRRASCIWVSAVPTLLWSWATIALATVSFLFAATALLWLLTTAIPITATACVCTAVTAAPIAFPVSVSLFGVAVARLAEVEWITVHYGA